MNMLTTTSDVRLAVIGAGHLGRIHARLAAQLDNARLAVVVDPDEQACAAAAEPAGAACVPNWKQADAAFDAAIVAAPTSLHYQLGTELLRAGKHVLMEKPICSTVDEARQLTEAARQAGRVLQVGHIERFNPAFAATRPLVDSPMYVEAARESHYTGRSVDVGVVLDLMIHDLDLTLALIDSPLQRVSAVGAAVVGPHEDMAQAWLEFANGAVACLKASRVSADPRREMRVIGGWSEASIDFAGRTATIRRPSLALAGQLASGRPPEPQFAAEVSQRHLPVRAVAVPADANPLADEQRDFVEAIRRGSQPRVTGEAGAAALAAARDVLESIGRQQQNRDQQPHWPRRAA